MNARQIKWSEACPEGDDVDRFHAQELIAEGYREDSDRTLKEARRAWKAYRRRWETLEDLRRNNDDLAALWLPYIYSREVHRPTMNELVQIIGDLEPKRILDIGCGVGLDACFLATRFPEVTVRGTDVSQGMLARANARAMRLELTNRVRFTESSHAELPQRLAGATFDFIYAHGSILYQNVYELYAHICGVASVMELGATFFCEMPIWVHPSWFIYEVEGVGVGLKHWNDKCAISILEHDGNSVCWCTGFKKTHSQP